MREMPLGPDVPGRQDQKKHQRIFPAQKRAKPNPRFAIKNREQNKNRGGVNDSEQPFRQARQRSENPDAGEPHAAMAPPLIAAYSAEHRASYECGDERFGHDNAREKKCAAEAEIDQTCDETAPVI